MNIVSIYFYHFQEYGRMELKHKEKRKFKSIFFKLNYKNVEYTGETNHFSSYYRLYPFKCYCDD